jgi:hypothetical protein
MEKAVVKSNIRPEADSSDSDRDHSSEEWDYEEELDEARDLRDSRYHDKLAK